MANEKNGINKIDKSKYKNMYTDTVITYESKYIPQQIFLDIIESKKSTELIKHRTGSGATTSILKLKIDQRVILVAPTVQLVKDKEQKYSDAKLKDKEQKCSDGDLDPNINISFLYGGSKDLIENYKESSIIMATPDQVAINFNTDDLVRSYVIVDETHYILAASSYRDNIKILMNLISNNIASGNFLTITATGEPYTLPKLTTLNKIKVLNKMDTELKTINVEFISKGQKVNKQKDTMFYQHIKASPNNSLLYFSNSSTNINMVYKAIQLSKNDDTINLIVGHTIDIKSKLDINSSAINLHSKNVLASSAGMEGIDVNLSIDQTDVFVEYTGNTVSEFNVSSVIQAFGRIRGSAQSYNLLIDLRQPTPKFNKPIDMTDDYEIVNKLNSDFSAEIFSSYDNLKKHEHLFIDKGYCINQMNEPNNSNKVVLPNKSNILESARTIITHFTNTELLKLEIKYNIANKLMDSRQVGSFSFQTLMKYLIAYYVLFDEHNGGGHLLSFFEQDTKPKRIYSKLMQLLANSNIIKDPLFTPQIKDTSISISDDMKIASIFQLAYIFTYGVENKHIFKRFVSPAHIQYYNIKHHAKGKIFSELTTKEVKSELDRIYKGIKNIYINYLKDFSSETVKKVDYREYSSVDSINLELFIAPFFPKSCLEIDITSAYPTFVDIKYGSKIATKIYSLIMDNEKLERPQAKVKYNMMLNLWQKKHLKSKEDFFINYYGIGIAKRIIADTLKRGAMFNVLSEVEMKVVEEIKSKILNNDDLTIDNMVRRHDSLLIFSNIKDLLEVERFIGKFTGRVKLHTNRYFRPEYEIYDYKRYAWSEEPMKTVLIQDDFDILKNFFNSNYGGKSSIKTKIYKLKNITADNRRKLISEFITYVEVLLSIFFNSEKESLYLGLIESFLLKIKAFNINYKQMKSKEYIINDDDISYLFDIVSY